MSDLESKIIDVISKENFKDLGAEYLQSGIDIFLEEEIVSKVPIIGTLRSLLLLGRNIKDRILLKKLCEFLVPLNTLTEDERHRFAEKIGRDEKTKQETGLKLIMLIDKIDDFNKPRILSNLFIAVVREQITTDTFFMLSTSVTNAYIGDLKMLKEQTTLQDEVKERLYNNALFSITIGKADGSSENNRRRSTIEVESDNRHVYNELSDSGNSVKEIKDRVTIEFDYEINTMGLCLKEFGLKDIEIQNLS